MVFTGGGEQWESALVFTGDGGQWESALGGVAQGS